MSAARNLASVKNYSAAAALSGGDVVVVGNRVAVVQGSSPIAIGDSYGLEFHGPWELDAKSTDEWADGAILYWDATEEELTDTAGSNKTAGIAIGAKANGQLRAGVDLNASVGSTTV